LKILQSKLESVTTFPISYSMFSEEFEQRTIIVALDFSKDSAIG
jgi:hypothetical protein